MCKKEGNVWLKVTDEPLAEGASYDFDEDGVLHLSNDYNVMNVNFAVLDNQEVWTESSTELWFKPLDGVLGVSSGSGWGAVLDGSGNFIKISDISWSNFCELSNYDVRDYFGNSTSYTF